MDVGPGEPPPTASTVARPEPTVVGAGRSARPLSKAMGGGGGAAHAPTPADWKNVNRNDPCPCGSGKKFKKCHGLNA
jgi:preprotein translocase subunit SecA